MKIILLFCLYILSGSSAIAQNTDEMKQADLAFKQILSGLLTKSFSDKEQVISSIAASKHQQSLPVLKLLLDGKIYYRKSDKALFSINIIERDVELFDLINNQLIATIAKKKLRKVGINNKLRGALKSAIAQLSLADADPKIRKQAIIAIFNSLDEQNIALIQQRLTVEQDQTVLRELATAINLYRLASEDQQEVIMAVTYLADSLHPETRVYLHELRSQTLTAENTQARQLLLATIDKSLHKIESSVNLYKHVENIFFGLSLGSVLLLAAVGLAITFGVMGVINMAHGEMIMLGAYTTFIMQQLMPNSIAYSLLYSLPVAFIFTALVGIAIERGVIRFLYGRPLETLLATFGISLILQQAVRTFISPQNRAVASPDWISGSLQINPALAITYNRLYIIIFSFMVLAGLMLLLKKTSFGLQIRAVTQNRAMAKAMGIRTDWVDAFTFGLGSGIAGMAGVALSQLTNVGPNMGQAYIIDSFMVVVFGGVGNLWGTLFGAMTLGIANKYIEPLTGAVVAKVLILVFIILFIQKKPSGMFALKGRSVD